MKASSSRAIRTAAIRLTSSLFPDHFAGIGARLFLRPRPVSPAAFWTDAFEKFDRASISLDGLEIPYWSLGEGPRVLLVHGWERDHQAMGGFVGPLLAQGFSVTALDLPAHGQASGRSAPLPLLARSISAVANVAGPCYAVIAHSVGGATSVLAMESHGLRAERLVLLGAPNSAWDQAMNQARAQGLSRRAQRRMAQKIGAALGEPLERFRVDVGLEQADAEVLLVHAQDDSVVPFSAAQDNARHGQAQTFWLERGGHNRILAEASVMERVLGFLGAPQITARTTSPTPSGTSSRQRPVTLQRSSS